MNHMNKAIANRGEIIAGQLFSPQDPSLPNRLLDQFCEQYGVHSIPRWKLWSMKVILYWAWELMLLKFTGNVQLSIMNLTVMIAVRNQHIQIIPFISHTLLAGNYMDVKKKAASPFSGTWAHHPCQGNQLTLVRHRNNWLSPGYGKWLAIGAMCTSHMNHKLYKCSGSHCAWFFMIHWSQTELWYKMGSLNMNQHDSRIVRSLKMLQFFFPTVTLPHVSDTGGDMHIST